MPRHPTRCPKTATMTTDKTTIMTSGRRQTGLRGDVFKCRFGIEEHAGQAAEGADAGRLRCAAFDRARRRGHGRQAPSERRWISHRRLLRTAYPEYFSAECIASARKLKECRGGGSPPARFSFGFGFGCSVCFSFGSSIFAASPGPYSSITQPELFFHGYAAPQPAFRALRAPAPAAAPCPPPGAVPRYQIAW